MENHGFQAEIHTIKNLFKPRTKVPKNNSEHLACVCSVCIAQQKRKIDVSAEELRAKEDFANFSGDEKSFNWLLEQIGKASNETCLKINIPETVVFLKGQPAFMIVQKFDRSIRMVTEKNKLGLSEIRKMIPTAVRLRRKEDPTKDPKELKEPKEYKDRIKSDTGTKEMALVKFLNRPMDDFSRDEGSLRVLSENDFLNLMSERAGSLIWKKVSYMQGCVKTKTGLNGSFVLNYYAHIENDSKAIQSLQNAGDLHDDNYENNLDEKALAEFISRKIAYALAIYCQYEVLRFCPEFIKDENGKLWLISANRISVREIDTTDYEFTYKKVELRSAEKKEQLNDQLAGYVDLSAVHKSRMNSFMSNYYSKLKSRLDMDKHLKDKPKDMTSDEIFKQLRPYSKLSFTQITNPESQKSLESLSQTVRKVNPGRKVSNNFTLTQDYRLSKTSRSSIRQRSTSRLDPKLKTWLTPVKRIIM